MNRGVRDHFRLGGGGTTFLPESLILCPKSRICLDKCIFVAHGGGGGGIRRTAVTLKHKVFW